MDLLEFRDYCLSLPLTEETTPFDEDVLVYKIGGKMYVYVSMSHFERLTLKCAPERIAELTERHPEIGPPIHMAKGHWISVYLHGDLRDSFIKELIRDSYHLVVEGITPKAKKLEVKAAIEEFVRQENEEL